MMENRPVQLDGKNRVLLTQRLNQVKTLYLTPGMGMNGKELFVTERLQVVYFAL